MKSMSHKRTKASLRRIGACAVALWMTAAGAWGGGIVSPLYVGNLVPVLDQYGRPMEGSNRSAEAAQRSRVEIRTIAHGPVQPPAADGTAHPDNPLVSTNSVGGIGMNTAIDHSGLFCMVFPNRLPPGTKIFARAYNAPTVADASFYADTEIGVVPGEGRTSLVLTFGAAQPLDSGDADGDGLANSWEKSLGTDDRLTSDYDGDGMDDRQELIAGTDLKDADARLAFRSIQQDSLSAKSPGAASSPLRLCFQSVPGKSYQLQFADTLVGQQAFGGVGEIVTAKEGQTEIDMAVELPEAMASGVFRVVLVSP